MKIKVCFNNETHRISKVPETFSALAKLVSDIFLTSLPKNWILEYIDSEGDKIMLGDEQDYKEFINSEVKGHSNSSAVKVFIVPKGTSEESQILSAPDLSVSDIRQRQEKILDDESFSQSKPEDSVTEEMIKLALEEQVPLLQQVLQEVKAAENVPVVEEKITVEEVPKKEEEAVPVVNSNEVSIQVNQASESKSTETKDLPKDTKVAQVQVKPAVLAKKPAAPKKQGVKKVMVNQIKVNGQSMDELVNKAVEKNLIKIASMVQSHLNQPKAEGQAQSEVKPAIHRGVRCDSCNVMPIVGTRFKCSVLPNFDFCELCEQTKEHPYAFIKIKYPGQVYSHMPKKPMVTVSIVAPTDKAVPQIVPVVQEKKETQEKPKVEEKDREEVKESKPEIENQPEKIIIEEVVEKKPEVVEVKSILKESKKKVAAPTYSRQIMTKAAQLKQLLPEVNYDLLLAFVEKAPADLDLVELMENFKY